MNRQYLDPVFLGRYPAELREIFGEAWPEWPPRTSRSSAQPIDFLGINYYTRSVDAPRPQSAGRCRRAPVRAAAARPTPRPAGRSTRRRSPTSWSGSRSATATSRSTSPRTAPRSTIRRGAGDGRVRRSAARRLPAASTCGAVRAAIERGRRRARLLRLVAARQLRVVPRLLQALRHRPRRLRDAASARPRTAPASTPASWRRMDVNSDRVRFSWSATQHAHGAGGDDSGDLRVIGLVCPRSER